TAESARPHRWTFRDERGPHRGQSGVVRHRSRQPVAGLGDRGRSRAIASDRAPPGPARPAGALTRRLERLDELAVVEVAVEAAGGGQLLVVSLSRYTAL